MGQTPSARGGFVRIGLKVRLETELAERRERRVGPGNTAGDEPQNEEYVNADDLFYWMEDECGADIPLAAIWIDVPMGCRFCC
jgi:hypothetical protein